MLENLFRISKARIKHKKQLKNTKYIYTIRGKINVFKTLLFLIEQARLIWT